LSKYLAKFDVSQIWKYYANKGLDKNTA